MNICVIGLGKIGLPLAVHFAKMGNSVIGSDINKSTVDLVNSGNEPFPEEENLQQFLNEVIRNKDFRQQRTIWMQCLSQILWL